MRPPRSLGLAAVAVLIASLGVISTPSAFSQPPPHPAPGNATTITLVTGDQVLLHNNRVVKTQPGSGRKGIGFMQQQDHGDIYVIPTDAAPLVAAGRVDRRLFNVSKLSKHGLRNTPVILTYEASSVGSSRIQPGLRSINGEALRVANDKATAFWSGAVEQRSLKGGISKIWLDAPVEAKLDHSVGQIGAPAAWQAGHTGNGITVAVLDTGIDATHPDLSDAIVDARDFTDSATGTKDVVGHGTHVAGTITGNGAASSSKYVGVAPDAKLLNGKVLNDDGFGFESGIIAGMEWAAAEGAEVINMSLGSDGGGDGTAPMDLAVNRITAQTGALFVIAAGNSGPAETTVASPGSAEAALTVGAVDRQDAIAPFSSRGPLPGNLGIKPDITAPGVDIVSAMAEGSSIGGQFPVVDGRYVQISGTSMATPHVAGAAAILAGQHQDWDAEQLKSALMNSAKPNDKLSVHEQGSGRVDVARAIRQDIVTTPASISNGVTLWPHEDDQPITKVVTYHNGSAAAISLNVSVQAPGAPAGMFAVDRSQVTVPTHGSASVRMVTNTAVPAADRAYSGAVIATNSTLTVRTAFSVIRETESYDISVSILDRQGKPTADYFTRLIDVAAPVGFVPYDESGTAAVRLPKGRYYLDTLIFSPDSTSPSGRDTSILVEPEVVINKSVKLVLDAREAKVIGAKLDRAEARPAGAAVLEFIRSTDWGETGLILRQPGLEDVHARPTTTTVTSGTFSFLLETLFARPDGVGGFAQSPYLYHIRKSIDGKVPAELIRIRDRDLATVHTRIASANPGETVSKEYVVDLATPATLTEFYSPDTAFSPTLAINRRPGSFEAEGAILSDPVTYKLGKPLAERWNVGVFGPRISRGFAASLGAGAMSIAVPFFADQAPNRSGYSTVGDTTMSLSQNGKVIGEQPGTSGGFFVPSGPGRFELSIKSTRPTTLSSEMSAKWTFEGLDGALPLMMVRFAPNLDEYNRAKAGRLFTVPVQVQQSGGSAQGQLKNLRVSVSYNDGKTWHDVLVLGKGLSRTALLLHPKGKGFVSLRATASDSKGNKVEQTTIHAYELTP